ncbi:GMC family oxidoreductase [Paraburkholderia caffeinilytica]|uniref:GMC family oxidoreductase n=1 Tax=Paraburkholderia caffeinilytica TaxID=1761016 RepID=UPI0038BD7381
MNAKDLTANLSADVLVIGSGPSGAVFAKRAHEAGLSVVCLEQGEWVDYNLANADRPEFELTASRDWNYVPTVRRNVGDYPMSVADSEIVPLFWNGVGGSSISWAANWMRNLPSDFRVRTLDGVADDWPISYQDLLPHYERVEQEFYVSGVGGDPMYPGPFEPPLPPADLTRAGRIVAETHNKMGWHWWPGSNAIATVARGNMKPCQQRTACMWGCIESAKASTDRTHWKSLIQAGVQLVSGARVTRIELNDKGEARGAVFVDVNQVERFASAKIVVLAANAIGTARILLSSHAPGHENGLANSSGLVGKRLMLHPTAAVVGLFDQPLDTYRGVWGQLAYCLQFYETSQERDFVRGSKWSLQPTGGPLSAARRWPWGDAPLFGENFHEEFGRRFGRSLSWGIICEDLPDERNHVSLDPENPDSSGMAGVKIHYETGENAKRMLKFMTARAQESLQAAGAYRTVVAPQSRESGWHILGTAKMGADSSNSVVDAYGRCHDIPNLRIVDGSVWPTSAGVNPTATIAAFSSWSAHQLVRSL